mgnify:CR=1 FL=1
MKQLPNILTLINLFSGVGMIMFILMGEMYPALILMVVALFMDVMDGRVAYWLKAQSELGKQLDSLADMVSFGVVPGVMMASMINEALGLPFPPSSIEMTYQSPLYAVGFLIPVFAALRLAKFNLEGNQDRFEGVPTPAIAILVSAFWYGLEVEVEGGLKDLSWTSSLTTSTTLPYLLIALTGVLCYLMIAKLPLLNLKFKGFGWKENRYRYLLILSSVILLAIFGWLIFPVVFLLYLGLSFAAFVLDV